MHKDKRFQRDKTAAPTGRVVDLLIILPSLKVREWREQPGRVRHNLETTIDEALFKELFERPPNTLHKTKIKRLVIVIKVDPATHALDGSAPLGRVAHHDRAAFRVILVDAHREHVSARRDSEFLVNFVLDGYAVRVPPKAPRYVEAGDVCVARDDVLYIILLRRAKSNASPPMSEKATSIEGDSAYLDRSGKKVTIMRQPGSKGRPVVERVYGTSFGELEARFERVNFAPKLQYFLFLLWEVES
jgi:hypothetical protein